MGSHWKNCFCRLVGITDNPASIALVIWKAVIVISRVNRINVIVYLPETAEGQREIERRIARVHADAVVKGVDGLDCTTEQKLQLFDSIIRSTKQEYKATLSASRINLAVKRILIDP
ncbi:MAG: hypothetical protein J5772_00775 [Clostridia bacterium]|nr:hypothetical protein [Clostridia bacterium]